MLGMRALGGRLRLPTLAVATAITIGHVTTAAAAPTTDLGRLSAAGDPAGTAHPLHEGHDPGNLAPQITLPTTAGDITFGGGASDESWILFGKSELSEKAHALWNGSVEQLLAASPGDVNYVFMSYADTPDGVTADITAMQAKVEAALAKLPADEQAHWRTHVHYVTENPLRGDDDEVAGLFQVWGPVMADVRAQWDAAGEPVDRSALGTTDDRWAASLLDTGPVTAPVAWYGGEACGRDAPTSDLAGRIALIARGTCNFADKAANALAHGAVAALIYTTSQPIVTMPGQCSDCPQIPVAMIDQGFGLAIRRAVEDGAAVTVTMTGVPVGVELMAVDQAGTLREPGFIPYPFNDPNDVNLDTLFQVAQEAKAMHFQHVEALRIAAEDPTVIPVFRDEWASDPGWQGKRAFAVVDLPSADEMKTYDTLEVELNLTCEEGWHGRCGAWDYLVYLYLCDADNPTKCDFEFGRWITAYWSGGHWITDLTPMMAKLSDGGRRRFEFWTVQKYQVDMNLIFSNHGKGLVPKRAAHLLEGGPFWKDYNARFHPMEFKVPEWAEKVEIAAFITGHGGSDARYCAEFCNHTHHFSVNGGPEHVKDNPTAGTLYGCLNMVDQGVVPNQGGTWPYGRAGWCPGLDVPMWTADITSEVRKGEVNTISYRGLVDGQDYVSQPANPGDNPQDARIEMHALIVYYASPDVVAGPVDDAHPRIPGTLYLPDLRTPGGAP